MKRPAIIGLAVILAFGVFIILVCNRDPRYQGRPLTSWLQQYSDGELMESQRLEEARQAVLAIGARKALPRLLSLAETVDDPVSTWTIAKSEKFRIRFLHWRSVEDSQLMGFAGFEIFGTNAAAAVPELTRLLADRKRANVASRCLAVIGKPAESALCRCLTNQSPEVRRVGVMGLAAVTDDVEIYLARIKDSLKDSNARVRIQAVGMIGNQAKAPELAVPLLIAALNDSDDMVVSLASSHLSRFGINAAGAFSTLTNLVNSERGDPARDALKALPKIDPAQAVPVLSNVVVNGKPAILGEALRSLKLVAPEMALKMTLEQVHSPQAERRENAVIVALDYDLSTPGIVEALKSAAKDSDPQVAQRAVRVMKDMLQKEEGFIPKVHFQNDPSYDGKSLGEWLEMRGNGSELDPKAVEALRKIGTNAIPALLERLTCKDPFFGLLRYEVSFEGMTGLISLGNQAVPALPELQRLMDADDEDLVPNAMMASLGTGTNALPCLIKGIGSRNPYVHQQAINTLTDWSAQSAQTRAMAVSLLTNLFDDPDLDIRFKATNEIKRIEVEVSNQKGKE